MNKKLIVNADDYGHTPGVSRGIREAHLHGIVTSTTAMMNMPGVDLELPLAIRECPDLGIGVHLVLTTGKPLLDPVEVSTLVNTEGYFYNESELVLRIKSIDLDQVRNEWKKQIEKFLSITGRNPDHLDSHHHAAYFSPGLCKISLELAQETNCGIRFPTMDSGVDILGDFSTDYACKCNEENQDLMKNFVITHPDHFLRSFYGDNCEPESLLEIFTNLSEGTTEIMCHPGYPDEELSRLSSYTFQRQKELDILTKKEILTYINTMSINLINYGCL